MKSQLIALNIRYIWNVGYSYRSGTVLWIGDSAVWEKAIKSVSLTKSRKAIGRTSTNPNERKLTQINYIDPMAYK